MVEDGILILILVTYLVILVDLKIIINRNFMVEVILLLKEQKKYLKEYLKMMI